MDPVLVILRAYLRAITPFEDEFGRDIIPEGKVVGTWKPAAWGSETFHEVTVQGERYYLVLGWAKHTPYHEITRHIDRPLNGAEEAA